eukprot:2484592-Alexandrium_andersonii.AAC.1
MHQWVHSWHDPVLYGAFQGQAADTASWLTALDLEAAKCSEGTMSAMAIDIFRALLHKLAIRMGAPQGVMKA